MNNRFVAKFVDKQSANEPQLVVFCLFALLRVCKDPSLEFFKQQSHIYDPVILSCNHVRCTYLICRLDTDDATFKGVVFFVAEKKSSTA